METADQIERAVRERYEAGAQAREEALCCPVDYDTQYLKVLPAEILERDYGCGDPSAFVKPGDTVLDLGSGAGKICFIAAQIAGAEGKVIGVDFNDEMLGLAEQHREAIGETIGFQNVEFRKGRIQDLRTPLARVEAYLAENPVTGLADLEKLEAFREGLRVNEPLVADASVDLILSNCVLNLVEPGAKVALFQEMFRVLKKGGRVAISDIVSDEEVPEHLQKDPELWSGCISGAFREDAFLKAFEDAGFHAVTIEKRDETPWRVVEGIEFRSMTVTAWKGKQGPCFERKQAVVYKGPWKKVVDDDGHTLLRGQRMAVCDKTFHIYMSPPYRDQMIPVLPHELPPLEGAPDFDCSRDGLRHPKETKGEDYAVTDLGGGDACEPGSCC